MKRAAATIGELAEKAAKHRQWHWCRRQNGFSDKPLWRVVARRANVPVYQVVALVNRLEEFANAADHRGSVALFSAQEFAAALEMTEDEAARIFAALETPEIGWVAYEHVASFHDRNPDKEDDTATERKRRQRARQRAMRELARRFSVGEITADERARLEAALLLDARLSTGAGHIVTPVTIATLGTTLPAQSAAKDSQAVSGMSTGHASHIVTPRDIVTVTPEQNTDSTSAAVDKSGQGGGGEAADNRDEETEALKWLRCEGKKLLVERIGIVPTLAETYIERWRRDLQDDDALQRMILGAETVGYIGPRFHTIVTDQVRRGIVAKNSGPQLPLPPVLQSPQKKTGTDQ